MSNHISKQPRFKTCSSGDDCKHPHGPVLPEYEFYDHMGMCKACQVARAKTYTKYGKDESSEPGELLVINKLRSLGIYAAPGKASEFSRLDVVAWGCVRIEVKTAKVGISGRFHFGMGHKKKGKEYERSDLVVFVCLDDPISYHVFPSEHPALYHSDGRAKKSIAYSPSAKFTHSSPGLDNDNMSYYQNAWDQIEAIRQSVVSSMVKTCETPEYTGETGRPQIVEYDPDRPIQLQLL